MLTVTALARKCDISRTTVLYYERIGLFEPCYRSDNGYRWYGNKEVERLKSIIAYRSFGVPVLDIAPLLDNDDQHSQSEVLKGQFKNLENEILKLRKQQQAIVVMLQEPELLDEKVVEKSRWIEIMESLGFDKNDMAEWHHNFEIMKPKQHQKFLESLGIDSDEIKTIRNL